MMQRRLAVLALVVVAGLSIAGLSQWLFAAGAGGEMAAKDMWHTADGFRAKRNWDMAVKAYERAGELLAEAKQPTSTRHKACENMIEFCKAMPIDVKALSDGTWTGKAWGYQAEITVEVVLEKGRIKSFQITDQKESAPKNALKQVPASIVKLQSPNVEASTGATVTSYGIMTATLHALQQAKPAEKPADKGGKAK